MICDSGECDSGVNVYFVLAGARAAGLGAAPSLAVFTSSPVYRSSFRNLNNI